MWRGYGSAANVSEISSGSAIQPSSSSVMRRLWRNPSSAPAAAASSSGTVMYSRKAGP